MENTKIEWTHHTFNAWWGCMKVSEGCKNCYAETLDNIYHHENPHWGPNSSRKAQSDKYWNQPLKWNSTAAHNNRQYLVFCSSMADVFEGHPDTLPHLKRLFKLIEDTPFLIWQLLTKRPENIEILIKSGTNWYEKGFPENVWIGTSIENQDAADKRIPYLLKVPSQVRFLSCEPLLGPVNLTEISTMTFRGAEIVDALDGTLMDFTHDICPNKSPFNIDWVIVGGESGHSARPMNPEWVKSIQQQCANADIPFLFKQWGEWGLRQFGDHTKVTMKLCYWIGDEKYPNSGNINNDHYKYDRVSNMGKIGKKETGNLLDRKQYLEFPKTNDHGHR